ncbi:major capsid protein [Amorphus orientalis]|uniref:Major capsid protein n=1 Tax=Amorphus orientalis TaxID=649198 RepID=A0AAE3VTV5_9HYPH|nr:major capsid protein [Amorphus orientalis]MDQ0317718.1 hypothetical protein [Amorphus orientalis]
MSAPYKVWDTRKSLGVYRDVEPTYSYWRQLFFPYSITSTDEWIDFEKLMKVGRRLAPFVRPLAAGKPLYDDSSGSFRFKPAYVKALDPIDPTAPLVKRPGVDRSMLSQGELTPMQRRELLKMAITAQHIQAIERRWEWMCARAIIDAKVTIEGENYPKTELDFRRDPAHYIVKTPGTYWGDTGVSIFDDLQRMVDTMFNAQFGGFPTRITIGSRVWAVLRQDEEFMKHMDNNYRGPAATIERGLISAEKVVKVGEMTVGGGSGASIGIWLYQDTFEDDNGTEVPFMASTDIVLTATGERIMGHQCFGAIIDPYAEYQALEIFPRNWMETGDPAVEYMLHQSAPLMVPVNTNATLRATVVPAA